MKNVLVSCQLRINVNILFSSNTFQTSVSDPYFFFQTLVYNIVGSLFILANLELMKCVLFSYHAICHFIESSGIVQYNFLRHFMSSACLLLVMMTVHVNTT
jgi:hypothetical protein